MPLPTCTSGKTAGQIFCSPDDLKFCACMTLFAQVAPEEALFGQALDKYFNGTANATMLELLAAGGRQSRQ